MGKDSRADVVMSDADFREMEERVERLQNRENELLGKIGELENKIQSHTRQISGDRDALELKSLELEVTYFPFIFAVSLFSEVFS